jgi:acyl carrier protein
MLTDDVRDCIAGVVGSERLVELPSGGALVDSGLVSSIEIVAVAAALEERFGITIPDSAITVANFNTLGSLARLVEELGRGALSATVIPDAPEPSVRRSLGACLRRPVLLAVLLVVWLVGLDFGLAALMQGPLARRYETFLEFGNRLYPVSGGYSVDDLAFAVSQHRIVNPAHDDHPRVAVFGDSGTIGSWVHYDEAIPALTEAALKDRWPNVEIDNLAFYMQSMTKDMTILEAVIEESHDKFPFDVAVFTIGDDYFNRPFIDSLLRQVPFLSLNKQLLSNFIRRLPREAQATSEPLYEMLAAADAQHRTTIGSWLQRTTAIYHYAPFFRYFIDELPFTKLLNPNYNFEGQFAIGRTPLFRYPAPAPPSGFSALTGIPNEAFDNRMYNLLEATISLLHDKNIPVVLYLKPEGPREWQQFYKRVGDHDALSIAKDLCRDGRCEIADLRWALTGQDFTDSIAHYTPEANSFLGRELALVVAKELER